jgi:UDP-N-acetylmuramoyl-tripeptide--D-alanyl-D-alanine ligase
MLSLREVAMLTHGTLIPATEGVDSIHIDTVSTDSRSISGGALFVALTGEHFDGHAFIDDVAARGARAVIAHRARPSKNLPSVLVDDPRRALGDLAAGWRKRFDLPLIVVTGSNGKTTTKEMIAAILAAAFGEDDRCATRGNLNNDIGVPLTLLDLRTHHRAAVIELGMNHPNETARLAEIAQADIALIVNAQREHQEFMQSVAAVADEHALAIRALSADGVAVFPADDDYANVWRSEAGGRRIVDFACVTARDAEDTSAANAAVVGRAYLEVEDTVLHLSTANDAVTARIAAPGMHNARNATAAAAASFAAGIPLDAIRRGLEDFRPLRGRSQRVVIEGGTVLIDDSYNANPDSMRAAIDLLASHAAPRLLVMGDMGEVGGDGPRFHAEIGAHARERGVEQLYALGVASASSVASFGAGAHHFDAIEPLITAVQSWVAARRVDTKLPSGAIVVKGSRFMQMERVVAAVTGEMSGNGAGREKH